MARFARAGAKGPAVDIRRSTPLHAYPSRSANTVYEQGYERVQVPGLTELQPPPMPSWEQGRGKTPGFQWPWQRVFQSLVPKREKMGAGWPNYRLTPPRPERQGWGTAYLLFYEQRNRHTWPAGGSAIPQTVIEHPQTVPYTAFAPRL